MNIKNNININDTYDQNHYLDESNKGKSIIYSNNEKNNENINENINKIPNNINNDIDDINNYLNNNIDESGNNNNDEIENNKKLSYIAYIQDTYNNFKKNYRELYIVFVSIAIVMWFRGITGLVDIIFIKDNSIIGNLIVTFISVIIYLDDFSISEIFIPKV